MRREDRERHGDKPVHPGEKAQAEDPRQPGQPKQADRPGGTSQPKPERPKGRLPIPD